MTVPFFTANAPFPLSYQSRAHTPTRLVSDGCATSYPPFRACCVVRAAHLQSSPPHSSTSLVAVLGSCQNLDAPATGGCSSLCHCYCHCCCVVLSGGSCGGWLSPAPSGRSSWGRRRLVCSLPLCLIFAQGHLYMFVSFSHSHSLHLIFFLLSLTLSLSHSHFFSLSLVSGSGVVKGLFSPLGVSDSVNGWGSFFVTLSVGHYATLCALSFYFSFFVSLDSFFPLLSSLSLFTVSTLFPFPLFFFLSSEPKLYFFKQKFARGSLVCKVNQSSGDGSTCLWKSALVVLGLGSVCMRARTD